MPIRLTGCFGSVLLRGTPGTAFHTGKCCIFAEHGGLTLAPLPALARKKFKSIFAGALPRQKFFSRSDCALPCGSQLRSAALSNAGPGEAVLHRNNEAPDR
ncbi:MAG: hypothetical protein IKH03_07725 [Oscillospiraceae bacterium]|nr:hypothetical protein [Oscillospiraceae bacterium]